MAPVSSPGAAAIALGACLCCMSIPLFRAHVVAEVGVPGGLDAREDAGHGPGSFPSGCCRSGGLYLTVAGHDRHAADPQPRPRPRLGGVLRVSRGPAVVPCDNVTRELSDRPGQDRPDPSVSRGARLWRRPPPPGRTASQPTETNPTWPTWRACRPTSC